MSLVIWRPIRLQAIDSRRAPLGLPLRSAHMGSSARPPRATRIIFTLGAILSPQISKNSIDKKKLG